MSIDSVLGDYQRWLSFGGMLEVILPTLTSNHLKKEPSTAVPETRDHCCWIHRSSSTLWVAVPSPWVSPALGHADPPACCTHRVAYPAGAPVSPLAVARSAGHRSPSVAPRGLLAVASPAAEVPVGRRAAVTHRSRLGIECARERRPPAAAAAAANRSSAGWFGRSPPGGRPAYPVSGKPNGAEPSRQKDEKSAPDRPGIAAIVAGGWCAARPLGRRPPGRSASPRGRRGARSLAQPPDRQRQRACQCRREGCRQATSGSSGPRRSGEKTPHRRVSELVTEGVAIPTDGSWEITGPWGDIDLSWFPRIIVGSVCYCCYGLVVMNMRTFYVYLLL